MENEGKEKIKEVTKTILLTIAIAGGILVLAAAPGLGQVLKLFLNKEKYNGRNFNRAVKRLEKQKLIRIKEEGEKTIVEITAEGKKRVLKYKFDEMEIKKPAEWDGLWRLIIFDIPERKRLARDTLRKKFQELGFLKLQKSVFVYPYHCQDEIDFIKEIFEIRPYVNFVVAKSIDNEEFLKKHFDLTDFVKRETRF